MDDIQTPPATQTEQMPHPFWQHFSPKTLALIGVLILVTAGLIYLAVRQEQPSPKSQSAVVPTQSPAHATLSLEQETSTSATQTVDIKIDSNTNKITGAQVNLSYDPKVLSSVSVKPGPYFVHPTILFNTVDTKNGRISYVLAISPHDSEASGSGILATISYTLLPTSQKTTQLTFLPKTQLTQEGVLGSVLKSSTNLTITIPQNLQVQTATSSGK